MGIIYWQKSLSHIDSILFPGVVGVVPMAVVVLGLVVMVMVEDFLMGDIANLTAEKLHGHSINYISPYMKHVRSRVINLPTTESL